MSHYKKANLSKVGLILYRIGALEFKNVASRTYKVRLRWYHPIAFIVVLITLLIGLILFGIIGIKREFKNNPYKWK